MKPQVYVALFIAGFMIGESQATIGMRRLLRKRVAELQTENVKLKLQVNALGEFLSECFSTKPDFEAAFEQLDVNLNFLNQIENF